MSYEIKTLADKALLVKLSRSIYQPYAYDESATKQIEAATGVKNAGRYNKRLLKDNTRLAQTNEAFNSLYREYISNTVPWLDDGIRMVPNALYFEFADNMRGLIVQARAAADELATHWDGMVQADLSRLGPLGNLNDYPAAHEIRAKFDATIQFFPLPSTQDFRVDVSEEDKAEMEKAIKDAEDNVSKYLLKEMMAPVRSFVEKLSIPIGEKGHIFRDSLVENLAELTNRLPRLNINDDPEVAAALADIEAIVGKFVENPDVLRESPVVRTQARDKMAEVDAKLRAIMGY